MVGSAEQDEQDVRVAVLGPVQIEGRDHRLHEPAGTLAKTLIVALALARGNTLSTRGLIDELWADSPPRQERAALQTLVSRLRANAADGILASTNAGYGLAIAPSRTDLGFAAAQAHLARDRHRAHEYADAADAAERGLALWRGEPGADLADGPLAAELATRSETIRTELRLVRAASLVESGDTEHAVDDLLDLAATAPLDEDIHYLLLRALERAGRRNDAVRVFAELRARLRDQLGTNPGDRLTQLNTRLLHAESDVAASAPAPTRVRIGVRTSPNALVGRESDIERIEELLASSRLTTILGPGGIGKTRLAHEVANRSAPTTPAVIVVELASVRSPEDATLAFASTLGIREVRTARIQAAEPGAGIDVRTRILTALTERPTLLIVDNCEHIIDAAAAWVSDILDSTTNVRVLATSRAPLSIGAERVYPLEPLASTAGADESSGRGPAVELFLERARAARPSAVLPLDSIARLCDRLDGLPLAIELAAARTRSMSVDEIERRLENRFALLTGGERTAPERHRTLRAVIDWSWNLLTGREQILLRRLSRFPDGFRADAALTVAGGEATQVADDLDALVSQSLVAVTEEQRTGILRYRMLETVREFGDIQLVAAGETELVRDRMLDWGAAFARHALRTMNGSSQLATTRATAAEQDNLVSVLRTALDVARPDIVVTVFGGLGYFWTLRGNHTEVLSFGPAVEQATRGYEPEPEDALAAGATYTLLGGTMFFLDARTAARILSRLRRLKRTHPVEDRQLAVLSDLLLSVEARHGNLDMLTAYCDDEDVRVACMANLLAAGFYENAGDLVAALRFATRSYQCALEIDEVWAQSSAAQSIAQLHSQTAHVEEALEWAERARTGLELLEAAGDMRQLDWLIAVNSVSLGRNEKARPILERFARADKSSPGFDFVDLRAIGFCGLAEIALAEGRLGQGLDLYGQAVGVYADHSDSTTPWLNIIVSACVVARTSAGDRNPEEAAETRALVRRLRTRLIVTARLRSPTIDKPVLASGALGVAAWLLLGTGSGDGPNAGRIDIVSTGAELLALTERMSSRQDVPSLHRDRVERRVRERHGDRVVDGAKKRSASIDADQAGARTLELLRSVKI